MTVLPLLLAIVLQPPPNTLIPACDRPGQTNCMLAGKLYPPPPPPGAPPPPPPPPGADTDQGRAALSRLFSCLDGAPPTRTLDLRAAAERAVATPVVASGSEWRQAREVVLAYVRRRREQQACLAQADAASKDPAFSKADRDALLFNVTAYTRSWLDAARFEITVLVRFISPPEGVEEERARPLPDLVILESRARRLSRTAEW